MILQKFTQKMRQRRFSWSPIVPLLAIFVGLGAATEARAQAAYSSNNVTITADPQGTIGTTTTYYGQPASGNTFPNYQGADLGNGSSFNLASGVLTLDGAAATLLLFPNTTINSSSLQYRVYQTGTPQSNRPGYSAINLNLTSGAGTNSTGAGMTGSATYSNTNAMIDLLNQPAVLGGGNYTVDIQFVSSVTNPNGQTAPLSDPGAGSGTGYTATFQVVAPPVTPPGGTTTWVSSVPQGATPSAADTEWRNAANWSNGVPTRFANAVIPGKTTQPNGVAPILDDPNNPYEVQTLSLLESSNSTRAVLDLRAATLVIYGDLNQPGGGLTASTNNAVGVANPTQNSTIVFAGDAANSANGTGDQVIRGSLIATDVRIAGEGVKSAVNRITANNTLNFAPNNPAVGVILQTAVETSGGSSNTLTVTFDTSTNTVIDLNETGTLGPETNVSFIRGVTNSTRVLQAGVTNDFGNIGLEITPNKSTASTVQVIRIVGDALIGPVGSSATAVKRQFQVRGEVNSGEFTNPANVITSTIGFHYLDSTTGANELNGNTNESDLTLFRTINNGVPYQPLGGVPNPVANIVTQGGLTSLNTLTLGDRNNPLPVTMTAFNAVRKNRDVLLTWATASELNNKGYNVQVSTNGTEFETLGFVASKSANSTTPAAYSYTDTRIVQNGTRYYRLQQVDLDGRTAFYGPRAVTMEGAVAASLAAYPNPFSSDLTLALASPAAGPAMLRVLDLTGRLVQEQSFDAALGNNNVSLRDAANLKNGIYMVQLVSPLGKTTNLKVVKQ